MESKQRKIWVDIAKAIGIIIVIINHVELSLGPITFLGGMFFVPVFFMVAGYTYHYHNDRSYGKMIANRAKRLLLPYLLYNLFYVALYLGKFILNRAAGDAASCYVFGFLYARYCIYPVKNDMNIFFMNIMNSPTWFLPCLFLVYLIYEGIVRLMKNNMLRIGACVSVCFDLAVLIHYFCPILLPWSIDIALFCTVLFYLGDLVKQKNILEYLYKKPFYILAVLAVFTATAYYNGSGNLSIGIYGKSVILYLITAVLGSGLCMLASMWIMNHSKAVAKSLSYVGRCTLTILCIHLFVIAVLQFLMNLIHMNIIGAKVIMIILTPIFILLVRYWFVKFINIIKLKTQA